MLGIKHKKKYFLMYKNADIEKYRKCARKKKMHTKKLLRVREHILKTSIEKYFNVKTNIEIIKNCKKYARKQTRKKIS